MNKQSIIDYMSSSSNVQEWNERREDVSDALQLEYELEMVLIKIKGDMYSIPKYLSEVNRLIDNSGLIVKTLKKNVN